MFVRCAYYVGTVDPKDQATFDDYVLNVHLQLAATWPRLRGLRLLKNNGKPYEGEAPRFYQAFELFFDSQADMDFCMAAEERKYCRQVAEKDIAKFRGLFKGEVNHVNYEVIDIPLRPKSK